MPARVIQTFIRVCEDCPECKYLSGGMYQCRLTDDPISPSNRRHKVGDRCPLPYAGEAIDQQPFDIPALKAENERLREALALAPSKKHFDILCEAMAEVKATSDGKSEQPIAEIVAGCLEEIASLNGGDY